MNFEDILQSPRLAFYKEIIDKTLSNEKMKRKAFYENITEQEKAEFINGEIITQSPVRLKHNLVGKHLLKTIDTYVLLNDLGFVGYEKLMIQLTRNDYEPDLCFFKKNKSQHFTHDQLFFPAPDFIVEILSKKTEVRDRGIKYQDYALHGVGEYWIIDPHAEFVEQYILDGETYKLIKKTDSGTVSSIEITGFQIPVRAIFDEHENMKWLKELAQP